MPSMPSFDLEPQLGQTARNRVLLYAKGRDRPGVDHVRTRHLNHHDLAGRNDDGGIGRQQGMVAAIAEIFQLRDGNVVQNRGLVIS